MEKNNDLNLAYCGFDLDMPLDFGLEPPLTL